MARGPFFINSFTPNETTEKALDLTLEVLKRLHEKGISEIDLNSAKTYIKGQFPTELETTDQLAATIAELEFFGLDEREIDTRSAKLDAMTVGDAKRIIQQYFPLENLVFVLIGKAAEISGREEIRTDNGQEVHSEAAPETCRRPADKSLGFLRRPFSIVGQIRRIHVLRAGSWGKLWFIQERMEAATGQALQNHQKLESLGLIARRQLSVLPF